MNTTNFAGILLCVGFFTILLFQTAFAGSLRKYGTIQEDPALETAVKQKQTLPDYQYYYNGRSHLPYAVIGIDPKYTLISKYWFKIDTKDQVTRKSSHLMPTGASHVTFGRILDSTGNQMGIWFSEYRNTIVRFGENNSVEIFSPYSPNKTL